MKFKHSLLALPSQAWIKLGMGLALSAGVLVVFAKFVDEILELETLQSDQRIYAWVHGWDSPELHSVMLGFTRLGSGPIVVCLSLLVLFWLWFEQKSKRALTLFVVANLGGLVLNRLLKLLFRRARPLIDPAIGALGYSLPSGHAMGAMIFYGFLAYLLIRSQRRLVVKLLMGGVLAGFILMIGISRIYLQAHYASDVLAGFLAGCCWLTSCILAVEARPWYHKYFAGKDATAPDDLLSPEADSR